MVSKKQRAQWLARFLRYAIPGFTLVELVVVITILAILGTIGFLSIGRYSANTRDSERLTDMNSMAKSLETFQIRANSYPTPDNPFTVTYSGWAVWYQGTFGSWVLGKLSGIGINKAPTDPLSNSQHTYSSLAYGRAFQIKADFEWDVTAFKSPFVDEAFAAAGSPTVAVIKGTYGGISAMTQTGGTVYVLAVPSIISNTGSIGQVLEIANNALSWALLINAGSNKTGIAFNPNIVAFSGPSLPTNDTTSQITGMMNALKAAYSWSVVNTAAVSTLLATPTNQLASLGTTVINTQLAGNASTVSVPSNAPTAPTASAASGISSTAITWNWQSSTGSASYDFSTNGTAWTTNALVLNKSETGLTCGTSYTRYVRACNVSGVCSNGTPMSATTSSCQSGPSALTLTQAYGTNEKRFNISWTAGSGNGGAGGCKLQFNNGASWTDITTSPAPSLNCDANLWSTMITLNGDGWKSSWNGTQIRIVRISDSTAVGTFPTTLACSSTSGSSWSTPTKDEDCNGQWDNAAGNSYPGCDVGSCYKGDKWSCDGNFWFTEYVCATSQPADYPGWDQCVAPNYNKELYSGPVASGNCSYSVTYYY